MCNVVIQATRIEVADDSLNDTDVLKTEFGSRWPEKLSVNEQG